MQRSTQQIIIKTWVTLAICITLCWAFIPLETASAQAATSPIYLLKNGDIWRWSEAGGLVLLTQNAHIQDAAPAPAGARLAARVQAPISISALAQTGGIGGGPLPADIALIDLASGAVTVIAAQGPDAAFFAGDGRPDNATLRGAPAWSPDGTRIAWTEIHYPDDHDALRRLMIYDVATNTTQVVATNLQASGVAGPAPMRVEWSENWLILQNVTLYPDPGIGPTYHSFDTTTGQFWSVAPTLVGPSVQIEDYVGVVADGRPLVAVGFTDGHWQFFDPVLGSDVGGLSNPALISLSNPANSLELTFTLDANRWNYRCANRTWTTNTGLVLPYQGCALALAPDGQAAAYVDQTGSLTIWQAGAIRANLAAPGPVDAIFWGPTGWRSVPTLTFNPVPPPSNVTCGNALPPRLSLSGWAQVIPGTAPNNVRMEAGINSTVVGQFLPGYKFFVMNGPECVDGMFWWFVDNSYLSGWTAEGDSTTYWIEPVN